MAKWIVALVAVAAISSCVLAVPEADVDKAKLEIVKKETLIAADAVRNITIRTPQCKVQLASMASDYMSGLNLVTYALNNVIPNYPEDKGYKTLAQGGVTLNTYAHNIQLAIAGDPEELKEKLAKEVELLNKDADAFEKEYTAPNEFIFNQLKRKHDLLLFSLYKLKYQALLFTKTNKELSTAINERVPEFDDAIKSLSLTDKTTEMELRHAMHHLSTILERNVYRLENWAEVNPTSIDDIKIVQEVSNVFSELYHKLIHAANGKNRTAVLKEQFLQVVAKIVENIVKLAQINYPDNLGGQEFIRSSLFDFVTFGKVYSDNIKAVLS